MELQPKKGRYNKENIIEAGHKILDLKNVDENDYFTTTQIEDHFGVKMTLEQRHEYCDGFAYKHAWRGYIPLFKRNKITDLIYVEQKLIPTKYQE